MIKQKLYFFTASYFKLFAQIKLRRWNPRIVVVTGSSGKTTLLHLLESQLSNNAKFSHHANSAIGIPFDILGIERKTLKPSEWIYIVLTAPFKSLSQYSDKKIYVVEADCDRPGEGKFLSKLLNPEVVAWISLSKTHSVNYDHLITQKEFNNIEDAIAYEFGHFIEKSTSLSLIVGESKPMKDQLKRSKSQVVEISIDKLKSYNLNIDGTHFSVIGDEYHFKDLLPKEVFYSLEMTRLITQYLNLPFDSTFSQLKLPTGRTSLYQGIKNTTLIDSSYNANLSSMSAILEMFQLLPSDNKWLVLGDMKELGRQEQDEHEKLASLICKVQPKKVLLLGPAITKYTYPHLLKLLEESPKVNLNVIAFASHKELLTFLLDNIKGNETILFKASQSLVFEGFIKHILNNPQDVQKLPRQEISWTEYKAKRGL